MDLTILMNFVAPFLLGAAIAYMMMRTRRVDWNQREKTNRATEEVYDAADRDRDRREHPPRNAP